MDEERIVQRIKGYCDYYDTKFVGSLDLIDMICSVIFNKEAFLTNKVGRRTAHNVTQQEADRIKEYIKYMESKKLIFEDDKWGKKYFRVAKELLN